MKLIHANVIAIIKLIALLGAAVLPFQVLQIPNVANELKLFIGLCAFAGLLLIALAVEPESKKED